MKNKMALIGLLSIGLNMFCSNPPGQLPPSDPSESTTEKVVEKIKKIGESIQSGSKKAADKIGEFCGKAKDLTIVVAGKAQKAGRAVGDKVVQAASVVGSGARKVSNGAKQVYSGVKKVSNVIGSGISAVGSGIDATTGAIKHGCGQVVDGTRYAYNRIPSAGDVFNVSCKVGFLAGVGGVGYWLKNGTDATADLMVRMLNSGLKVTGKVLTSDQVKTVLTSDKLYKGAFAAWMLKLLHTSAIKGVLSEQYLKGGVKDILKSHINKFLPAAGAPAKSDSDVQKWVDDIKMSEALRAAVTSRLKTIGYDVSDDEVRNLVVDQLNRDIHRMGNKVLCPTVWKSIKNFIFGKSGNHEINHIHGFTGPSITGKAWSRHNLFDIRHGSAAYVSKMLKLLVLRDILTR
jgi:hypothetical protein